MTSRGKNAVRSFETEIEKGREESNWKKAIELALQLKSRSPQHESLAHFLIGEGKLEAYLEEWPPTKDNTERAQSELSEARGYLTLATDEAGKKAGVALDAHLLLGKLNYACGAYEDALKNYKLAELNTLTEKELPVRSLCIVAESYAIKGLCLEQSTLDGSTSRFKLAEKDSEMLRSFSLACDLALLYLQRTQAAGARAGPVLETALQRVPILHIRAGSLQSAIDRYREMLTAVESVSTQTLRLTLARQLAEVLMRGVTGQVYKAPEKQVSAANSLSRRRDDHASAGPWKPKKYAGLNQFVPATEMEEIMLILMVGEAMAARDAVLSQSPEFEQARVHALRTAISLADLLAIACARWALLALLNESLERAMKFSFGSAHVWRQRALCAAAAAAPARPQPPTLGGAARGAGVRARGVLSRAAPLHPADAALRLVAANTHYQCGWIEDGIEYAEEALRIEEERQGPLLARACLYCGIGHQMKAQKSNSRLDKESWNARSLQYLLRACADTNDHLAFYHLAAQYVQLGLLNEAMDATRSCLQCRAESSGGLRLAALLWSGAGPAGGGGVGPAGGRGARALAAAGLARVHHPTADWPLWARAVLLLHTDPEEALQAGKELLGLLHGEAEGAEPDGELDALSDSHADTHSNRDAASIIAESVGASRAERALSDAASSSPRGGPAPRLPPAHLPRAHAWLLLADLCLRLDRVSAAAGCVAEAAALTPFSHLVLYTRGRVALARGEWDEARGSFQDALALHPVHVDSLVHLGEAYYMLGWLRLAEGALRAAAELRPRRADTWRRLARTLAALGDPAAAADCAAAALRLPLLPLDTL